MNRLDPSGKTGETRHGCVNRISGPAGAHQKATRAGCRCVRNVKRRMTACLEPSGIARYALGWRAMNEISFDIQPLGPMRRQYSGHKLSFKALMPDGLVRPFVVWMPIRDRRLARRVARREGTKFRKQGQYYVFR